MAFNSIFLESFYVDLEQEFILFIIVEITLFWIIPLCFLIVFLLPEISGQRN